MKWFTTVFILFYVTNVKSNKTLSSIDIIELIFSLGESQCTADILTVFEGVINLELWALKMVDSTGKIPSGFLIGNVRDMNGYDTCIGTQTKMNITGKYCTVPVQMHANSKNSINCLTSASAFFACAGIKYDRMNLVNKFKYNLYLCVPASCTALELETFYEKIKALIDSPFELSFTDSNCVIKENVEFSIKAKLAILFFICMLLILALATIYDINNHEKERWQYLLAFSIHRNWQKLFSVNDQPSDIGVISGLKVLNMVWIIMGHTVYVTMYRSIANPIEALQEGRSFKYSFITSSFLAVDTFFALSGILIMYTVMCYKDKIPLIVFYLYRVLRIYPSLVAIVIFTSCILEYTNDGPMWITLKQKIIAPCNENWWTTLLFLNNFVLTNKQCLPYSWYLATDTQLYIVSPIIFLSMKKWPKNTIYGIVFAIIGSILYSIGITIFYNIGASVTDVTETYFYYYYNATIPRSSSWFVGLLAGTCIAQCQNKPFVLRKIYVAVCWLTITALLLLLLVFYHYVANSPFNIYTAVVGNGLVKPLWAMCISWVVFACYNGYGGFINYFLTIKIFRVLGRLTYSMYLTHMVIMFYFAFSRRHSVYVTLSGLVLDFVGYFTITFIISIALFLMFEAPGLELKTILLTKDKQKKII